VIMPTYNPNTVWLKEAIESVRYQIYPNWELCIADDASTDAPTIAILKDFQNADSRIKVVFRKKNGHISQASNDAIELATGEWIALLDHDDLLPADALFWVASTINKNPEAQLIYSDEDKIDGNNKRQDPYFKCDWNYDLFLSQNMISHLGVYKTEIVRKIGGFRQGFEGSQDYDLALRFIEKISHEQIIHIPRVLYHWRIHKDSTALGADKKPYALISAKRAIGEHLTRKDSSASVEILENQMYRVKYDLPAQAPLVSIIILSKNNKYMLQRCIESITQKTNYKNYEILIVDNNSDDDQTLFYFETLKQKSNVIVLRDTRDFNFSALNNKAAGSATGEYICFLNNDIEVISPNWLSEMISIAIQPGVGAVGAKLWYPNDTLQHGGIILGIGGIGSHAHKLLAKGQDGYFNRAALIQEFSAVTGACMLISKTVFNKVGGFNETDLSVAYNDVDLCLRIGDLGYRIVWTPFAELYHYESATRGEDIHPEKRKRFLKESDYMEKTWGDMLKNDPAYSPNLSLFAEDFSLAWPPRLENIF
ncbi:MAG: glycosyltransferase family 2 protein, partial [Bacteroidota bacterium]|nr:glycosyltransferase family 2 protein [Bacteroidota bacterium]